VTHWLKEIGGINSNSYNRLSTASSSYVYFEKVRIAEGKNKSAGCKQSETGHPLASP
ncbi:hypothetical protein B0H11DRAFT_1761367, partial [Mycena galericulata]